MIRAPSISVSRCAVALALAVSAAAASAQLPGDSIRQMLGRASDSALDRLSRPGAFSSDAAIRIALPGGAAGKGLGDLMGMAGKAGLTGDLEGALNRAAETAAGRAKPLFRAAIDKVGFKDAIGILRGGDTGATDYLRRNTGAEIRAQLVPLVTAALESNGATRQLSRLKAFGLDQRQLADYVTGKTSDGIFTYVGREEAAARKDPVGTIGALLKGTRS